MPHLSGPCAWRHDIVLAHAGVAATARDFANRPASHVPSTLEALWKAVEVHALRAEVSLMHVPYLVHVSTAQNLAWR